MVDDVFGTSADKGFRGHLRALATGRLSTGGLKLLGIGFIAAVYGWRAAVQGAEEAGATSIAVRIGWWVAATLVIALSANLLNLTDLRPGRALKSYSVLAVAAGLAFALDVAGRYESYATELGFAWVSTDTAVTAACMLIVLLGPVVAVWRYDLGERGMLGDAGSNAMGAVIGYLLAGSLDLPTLAAVAVVLLGLNALSERVSFSAVIEAVPPLRYLDGLGRLRESEDAAREAETGGP
jgi:UDP-N-acetylmuramyl pentapeptide phosphotransferase/UDP-N-acetylglucosamine-1-phosphate transferase